MATTQQEIEQVEAHGFRYTLEPQYDVSSLTTDRGVQVRFEEVAPIEKVKQMAAQMGDAEFPAIVITRDRFIVDGNTRVRALHTRDQKFFPAIVLDVEWEKATEAKRELVSALGAVLNSNAGIGLSSKEQYAAVRHFIRLDYTIEKTCAALGVERGMITKVRQEMEAEAKMGRSGFDHKAVKAAATLRALGSPVATALNDQPYRQMAELAVDAGLNAKEVRELAKGAKETGSDAAAVAKIAETRQEMSDRIAAVKRTGSIKPTAAATLRRALGLIAKWEGCEVEVVEREAESVRKHLDAIAGAIAVLQAVLKAQEAQS